MKTLRIVCDFTYDDELAHGEHKDDKEWFFDLICSERLRVLSNEVGDEIGTILIREIEE